MRWRGWRRWRPRCAGRRGAALEDAGRAQALAAALEQAADAMALRGDGGAGEVPAETLRILLTQLALVCGQMGGDRGGCAGVVGVIFFPGAGMCARRRTYFLCFAKRK